MVLFTPPAAKLSMVVVGRPALTNLVCHFHAKVAHTKNCVALSAKFGGKRSFGKHRQQGESRYRGCEIAATGLSGGKQERRVGKISCGGQALDEGRASTTMAAKPAAPVLLMDVMGTLIRDPFYEDIPAFFGMTLKELFSEKHPTAWIEFETGQLTEDELLKKFFSDGRDFDIQGLKDCMRSGYSYLEGVQELLQRLQSAGYTMHAFSNYPCWYSIIEDKLELSQFMPWTFVSCHMGLRKPDAKIYLEAAQRLKLDPSRCIFIDDRRKNVEAAVEVGMVGIVFQDAKQLEQELAALGCHL